LISLITRFRGFRVFDFFLKGFFQRPYKTIQVTIKITICRPVSRTLAYFAFLAGNAPYCRGSVSLLIFLITRFRGFRIFGGPSHIPSGKCHQTVVVAINQPHGTDLKLLRRFWLILLFHLWFSTCDRVSLLPHAALRQESFWHALHSLLSYCRMLTRASISPT